MNRLKENIFFKTTLILIIGGIITKIFGFVIRIVYTRMVGTEIISIYSLVLPTYSLLITIATLALPTTISKLVAENKNKSLKVVSTSTFIITIINVLVVVIMLLSSKFIAIHLLKEPSTYILLISMTLTFPIISISSIIKGYFYGKQNMVPNVVSNIAEQIIRITLIILFIPSVMEINKLYGAALLFLISLVTETISIIINLLFLPRGVVINKNDLLPDIETTRDVLSISLPTVSSRIIGNIGYFFEPIILMNLLLYSGYTNNYILSEYGAYNAYSLTILTVPSFFIIAISSSLIPEISKYYLLKKYNIVKRRLKQALVFGLIIGLSYSIILLIWGENILYAIYKTYEGVEYIKILAPFFVLFYLESILMSYLQAINKANITMKITIIGVLVKLLSLSILSICHIGIYSLLIAEIINIFIVVFLNIKEVIKSLKKVYSS